MLQIQNYGIYAFRICDLFMRFDVVEKDNNEFLVYIPLFLVRLKIPFKIGYI